MRLIDADALEIRKAKREIFSNPSFADGWNSVIDIIQCAPTVNAVSVVRCKDCKHRRREGDSMLDWCPRLICGTIRDDFYCADGERIE